MKIGAARSAVGAGMEAAAEATAASCSGSPHKDRHAAEPLFSVCQGDPANAPGRIARHSEARSI